MNEEVRLVLDKKYNTLEYNENRLHVFSNQPTKDIARELFSDKSELNINIFESFLKNSKDLFSIIVDTKNYMFCAVDCVASRPIFYKKKNETIPTGTCLILVTPDSERTMCTFLGIAGKINENDINQEAIKKSDLVFLEGYLWDEGEPKKAFEKAIINSNKVAMSLSDQFCVERHKSHFLDLVKNKLNITFANE